MGGNIPVQESALALIQAIMDMQPKLETARISLIAVYGDFAGQPTAFLDDLYGPVVALLDAVLGHDDIASYFIHECLGMRDGGAVIERDGTKWPLKTVADLRAYLNREKPQ